MQQQQQRQAINAVSSLSADDIMAQLEAELAKDQPREKEEPPIVTSKAVNLDDAALKAAPKRASRKSASTGKAAVAQTPKVDAKPAAKPASRKKGTPAKPEAALKPEQQDLLASGDVPSAAPQAHWPFPIAPTASAGPVPEVEDAPKPVAAPAAPNKIERRPPPVLNPLRNTFAKKSEKIAAKLGDSQGSILMIEAGDEKLTAGELDAKQKALLKEIDEKAKKVGEKAVMLLGWIKAGGKLNEIMARTFAVLEKDGCITSGDEGNLIKNFLKKPYSIGTARAQASQMFMLLPALKICDRQGGKMVPNPNSALLPAILRKMKNG
ncbi:hypothetical protein ACODYM_28920 [Burkholderia gladioli]|uniref:hypothetical protein n=1 Tax=Burkholderia gladioli TaxID=28095 RepID=UPI003B4FFBD0